MRTGSTSLGRRALRRLLAAVLAVLTGVIGAVALYYLSVQPGAALVAAVDPFRSQAAELVSALKSHVVPLTTLLWTGTGDGLGHEYELNFNLPEARTAFQQTLVFLAAHTKG
jgi:acetyl esterase/lipase